MSDRRIWACFFFVLDWTHPPQGWRPALMSSIRALETPSLLVKMPNHRVSWVSVARAKLERRQNVKKFLDVLRRLFFQPCGSEMEYLWNLCSQKAEVLFLMFDEASRGFFPDIKWHFNVKVLCLHTYSSRMEWVGYRCDVARGEPATLWLAKLSPPWGCCPIRAYLWHGSRALSTDANISDSIAIFNYLRPPARA